MQFLLNLRVSEQNSGLIYRKSSGVRNFGLLHFAVRVENPVEYLTSSRNVISSQDIYTLIIAREVLIAKIPEVITSTFFHAADGYCNEGGCSIPERLKLVNAIFSKFLTIRDILYTVYRNTETVCLKCNIFRELKLKEGCKAIWDELPQLFGLPPWDDLLNDSEGLVG
ncbi:hypothetical protein M422DRAFT_269565 [Sphaerobolus stellatus SS14]|uniref:Uncharacterized protein n=1 Tax=Sphaerobolus stellatus (strain SS14) TaxID=990650 RepID=A0A0C9UVB9_SPHS4|nr:hypothetical protein M422DRAFT_269565 [Sphaerobolus stellatus SS14]